MFFILLLLNTSFSLEVHGHRGARSIYPENTIAAINYALENEVDYIEIDLHMTKDGHLVVYHDPYLNSNLCMYKNGSPIVNKIAIYELTLKDIKKIDCGTKTNPKFPRQQAVAGAEIPTLFEVLTLFEAYVMNGSKSKLNIEVKYDRQDWRAYPDSLSYTWAIIEMVENFNLANKIMLQSFSKDIVLWIKRLQPKYFTSYISFFADNNAFQLLGEVDALTVNHRFLGKSYINKAKDRGKKIFAWTANKYRHWDRLIAINVDGIITDDPVALQNFIALHETLLLESR